ncbi:Galectin-8 [Pteropus alecto]|uniref:Galectin n=1 Tax=Pteropus alecto TaxID=9402 RepID=L5K191_PTEAL|nr:Galectin-8 [Pteropus alecto]
MWCLEGGSGRDKRQADTSGLKAVSSSRTEHFASAWLAEVCRVHVCLRGRPETEHPILDRRGPGYSSGAVAEEGKEDQAASSSGLRRTSRDPAAWPSAWIFVLLGSCSPPSCLTTRVAHVSVLRFQVDLQNGSSVKPRADVVFHFNPRFKRSNCIVCNTLKNERWGREEITYDMPFKKEKSFEIVILVLEDKFQIIPYVGTIPEQLEPGTLIVIRGHVPGDSDRFQVDLQNGSSVKPRADVVFHFNPRFKRSNCIVCNTLKNERWGREEITYDMPFKKEKSFEIVILVLEDKFQVGLECESQTFIHENKTWEAFHISELTLTFLKSREFGFLAFL